MIRLTRGKGAIPTNYFLSHYLSLTCTNKHCDTPCTIIYHSAHGVCVWYGICFMWAENRQLKKDIPHLHKTENSKCHTHGLLRTLVRTLSAGHVDRCFFERIWGCISSANLPSFIISDHHYAHMLKMSAGL